MNTKKVDPDFPIKSAPAGADSFPFWDSVTGMMARLTGTQFAVWVKSFVAPLQGLGQSTTEPVSQKVVTDGLAGKADTTSVQNKLDKPASLPITECAVIYNELGETQTAELVEFEIYDDNIASYASVYQLELAYGINPRKGTKIICGQSTPPAIYVKWGSNASDWSKFPGTILPLT